MVTMTTTDQPRPTPTVIVVCALLLGLAGCGIQDRAEALVTGIAQSTLSTAKWEQLLADADLQVIEPGYEVYGGVLYVGGLRIRGASGRAGVSASGAGGEITPASEAAVMEALRRNPGMLERAAKALNKTP